MYLARLPDSKFLIDIVGLPESVPVKKFHIMEHRIRVKELEVAVFLEKYLDTGEVFLKNAWVVTKAGS